MTGHSRASIRRVVLVGGLAISLAACGVRAQPDPEPVPQERLPKVAPTTGSQTPTIRNRVWGTRDGRLVPVFVDLPRSGITPRINALLTLADPDLQPPSAIPLGTRLSGVEQRGNTVVLTFTDHLLRSSDRDVPLVLGQLVLTATEEPDVSEVTVRAADEPVLLVSADGTAVSRPLRRADFLAFTD